MKTFCAFIDENFRESQNEIQSRMKHLHEKIGKLRALTTTYGSADIQIRMVQNEGKILVWYPKKYE